MDISVRGLTKLFGALRANDGITLGFAGGQIHGVLGENGAGKSTLMKLLSGFLRPDGGEIVLSGRAVLFANPGAALHAGVGMVHQDPLDLPGFSVLENLICAAPRGTFTTRTAAGKVLHDMVSRLGFSVAADDHVGNLTVGQRQQLEIVRLLACGARVLILDEPTTGITATQARALFAALRQLANEGRTILFVSHKLNEVADLCDTVSVLRAGRVAGAGQMAMPQAQEQLLGLMFGDSVGMEFVASGVMHQPAGIAAPADRYAWQLESVAARDGNLRMDKLDLALPTGTVIGLAGLEGSGQQTVLRLLAGRLRPSSGRILFDGVDLTNGGRAAFRQGGVEYLPADRLVEGVVGALSLAEHFALLRPNGAFVDRQTADAAARKAIATYGIKASPASPIAALSGGNQQRAMLAMIADDVRGLVCEQPTRGLDVASAQAIWGRLLARRNAGCTVVFAAADLDEILAYSDYVLVFFAGQTSQLLPRAALQATRLAELIGGVGFAAISQGPTNA